MRASFYQFSYEELLNLCEIKDFMSSTASTLFNWHYKKNRREAFTHQSLSLNAKSYFTDNFTYDLPAIDHVHESVDKTVKFLFRLRDGLKVETVVIPFQGKYSICLSSQVGCAMGCTFCFTGEQGFKRHLATDEIVGQFLEAKRWLSKHRPGDDRILNIVYMGQGEPLNNFDCVKKSAEIFLSQHGLSIADHKITISTVGFIPGLERWKNEMPKVNIALSLHSPFTEKRDQLIPMNRRFPLKDVLSFVEAIPEGKKRFVTYEYLLVDGFNDAEADAHATGELLHGKKAFINLIPFNPYPGGRYRRPAPETILRFKSVLDKYDVPTTIRTTKGDEILAACGQLNTK